MTYPQRNISAEAGHRAMLNAQAAYQRRRKPIGLFGLVGRLISFVIMLAFLAGVAVIFLAVVSRSGLG
jgi:hypothetical protein